MLFSITERSPWSSLPRRHSLICLVTHSSCRSLGRDISLRRRDYATSPKNVCVGGYPWFSRALVAATCRFDVIFQPETNLIKHYSCLRCNGRFFFRLLSLVLLVGNYIITSKWTSSKGQRSLCLLVQDVLSPPI